MRSRRPLISYSNVLSTLALFVALGGTAVAAGVLDGKSIKKGSITGKQIKTKSVPGSDLRPNSIRGKQVLERTLGKVPRAKLADTAESARSSDHANTAGVADFATTAGVATGLSAALTELLADRCPAGTTSYAGVCFETSSRGPDSWPVAAKTCGDAGARLPHLSEIEGFRQEPGITLNGTEHTGTYLDLNGLDPNGGSTVGIADNGSLMPGFTYGQSNARYRCVFPMTNG